VIDKGDPGGLKPKGALRILLDVLNPPTLLGWQKECGVHFGSMGSHEVDVGTGYEVARGVLGVLGFLRFP